MALIEALNGSHRREAFSCGVAWLDAYLRERVSQDVRRHLAAAFVLIEESPAVIGYYTLSQQIISVPELPLSVGHRLPRYPLVPATLIGRLAVDSRYQGRGLGEVLLMDALARAWEVAQSVAAFAVRVDATDQGASDFYLRYGFAPFPDGRLKLFLPMAVLDDLFAGRGKRG